jgi:hypothetical protein
VLPGRCADVPGDICGLSWDVKIFRQNMCPLHPRAFYRDRLVRLASALEKGRYRSGWFAWNRCPSPRLIPTRIAVRRSLVGGRHVGLEREELGGFFRGQRANGIKESSNQ